jgi:hypothetical protein
LVREGCLGILGSYIYGCRKIYLKNEAVFGLDLDWDWVFRVGRGWRMEILRR